MIEKNYMKLLELKDTEYKKFIDKLIPNIDSENIIGIRMPILRKYKKTLNKEEQYEILNTLPHKYYEENNLHCLIINDIDNYDKLIFEIEKFLPYIDNWATCDLIRPSIFKFNLENLYNNIKKWINSDHTYTIRFAIEMLMVFYLEKNFKKEYLDIVSNIKTDEYYVKMMIAWYFATAIDKQYETSIKYLENNKLDLFTHNKAIQKIKESYKISKKIKEYVNTLKRKEKNE